MFWVAAGAAAGILVVQKLSRKARAFTPAGIGDSVSKGVQGIRGLAREFVEDMVAAAASKEDELLQLMAGPGQTEAERAAWSDRAEQIFGDLGGDRGSRR
ncbi:MAG: hypothetical protein L0Y54_14495 [Sporichthyaceae bacterium]|nr:hypothetical protein [Sporichthyaceae bacterium]